MKFLGYREMDLKEKLGLTRRYVKWKLQLAATSEDFHGLTQKSHMLGVQLKIEKPDDPFELDDIDRFNDLKERLKTAKKENEEYFKTWISYRRLGRQLGMITDRKADQTEQEINEEKALLNNVPDILLPEGIETIRKVNEKSDGSFEITFTIDRGKSILKEAFNNGESYGTILEELLLNIREWRERQVTGQKRLQEDIEKYFLEPLPLKDEVKIAQKDPNHIALDYSTANYDKLIPYISFLTNFDLNLSTGIYNVSDYMTGGRKNLEQIIKQLERRTGHIERLKKEESDIKNLEDTIPDYLSTPEAKKVKQVRQSIKGFPTVEKLIKVGEVVFKDIEEIANKFDDRKNNPNISLSVAGGNDAIIEKVLAKIALIRPNYRSFNDPSKFDRFGFIASKEKIEEIKETISSLPRDLVLSVFKDGKGLIIQTYSKKRDSYQAISKAITLSNNSPKHFFIHEFAHCLEQYNPTIFRLMAEFYAKRTSGKKLQSLKSLTGINYRPTEKGYKDAFFEPYMSKLYPNGTELLAMGIENLTSKPKEFLEKDPEYAKLILGILCGI